MKIILASNSPRRKEILSNLGIKFDVIVSDADEESNISSPSELVCELSRRKGRSVALSLPEKYRGEETLIISGDTVVSLGDEIFGKPVDACDAKRMITALSGKTHSVFSGMSVIKVDSDGKISEFTDFERTGVTFREMSEEEIDLYLSMENVLDKAGAYAIQGAASLWIDNINGNYFNIVGMPTNKLISLLMKAGVQITQLISSGKNSPDN